MLAGYPDNIAPMIMVIEHPEMNISLNGIKMKLIDMSADSEITKSEGAFIAKRTYQGSNKRLPNSGIKRTQISTTNFKACLLYFVLSRNLR